jgi:hypothetical protein
MIPRYVEKKKGEEEKGKGKEKEKEKEKDASTERACFFLMQRTSTNSMA